ncbi:hypothetical protein C7A12_21490 [Pseudomonas fluorescens]|nr:hypothetical protein C7A12_21490 [Pseudomonas fluorescens]PRW75141.1 hypothetical protein C7A13_21100 [Pseudomonas fluorescens]
MWIIRCMPNTSVGAGLLAKASAQQTLMLTDPPLSRASPLSQGSALDGLASRRPLCTSKMPHSTRNTILPIWSPPSILAWAWAASV